MSKTVLFFFISLFFLSCGKSGSGPSDKNANIDLSSISTNSPVPYEALSFETNVKLIDFNQTQEQKLVDAIELMKQVVASEEFKNKILNYTYNGKKRFVDTNLTNAQVYAKILEGAEKLKPKKNNTLDITLKLYRVSQNVIGYTLPSVNTVWMNTKYFNNFTPADVTGNLMHEWLHKLGFRHDYKRTPQRPYSVPYAIGYLMQSLAKKYQN